MENKSARDRAEEIVSKLKHQARILGSSGKGYGDFARVNREAARLICELQEEVKKKSEEAGHWLKEASKYYSDAQTLKEELKQTKKQKFVCFGWRKKNG